jgi:hypothetical protein
MTPNTPNIPYFIGRSHRVVPQIVAGAERLVQVPVDVVQGKVVSVGKIKRNVRGSEYCVARVAGGSQGFAMVKGYDDIGQEIAALSAGDIISCDGRYRPANAFDSRAGAVVVTHWFTARTVNLLKSPEPVVAAESTEADDYDGMPL